MRITGEGQGRFSLSQKEKIVTLLAIEKTRRIESAFCIRADDSCATCERSVTC